MYNMSGFAAERPKNFSRAPPYDAKRRSAFVAKYAWNGDCDDGRKGPIALSFFSHLGAALARSQGNDNVG